MLLLTAYKKRVCDIRNIYRRIPIGKGVIEYSYSPRNRKTTFAILKYLIKKYYLKCGPKADSYKHFATILPANKKCLRVTCGDLFGLGCTKPCSFCENGTNNLLQESNKAAVTRLNHSRLRPPQSTPKIVTGIVFFLH